MSNRELAELIAIASAGVKLLQDANSAPGGFARDSMIQTGCQLLAHTVEQADKFAEAHGIRS